MATAGVPAQVLLPPAVEEPASSQSATLRNALELGSASACSTIPEKKTSEIQTSTNVHQQEPVQLDAPSYPRLGTYRHQPPVHFAAAREEQTCEDDRVSTTRADPRLKSPQRSSTKTSWSSDLLRGPELQQTSRPCEQSHLCSSEPKSSSKIQHGREEASSGTKQKHNTKESE